MSRFDALELHACVEFTGTTGEKLIEQDDDQANPPMFSVYGHLISPGGIFCLEDFETHEEALAWMKFEATRCAFKFGFEDFWEHGAKEQQPTSKQLWSWRQRVRGRGGRYVAAE